MTLDLRPSRTCLALVQRFEGYRPRAARLAQGGWTIGYGHTASAREGAEVGPEDAEALLLYDLSQAGAVVRELTYAPLSQNQFDALTAFAFNIGGDRFRGSTVLRRVNAGDLLGAGAALEAWRNAEFEGASQVIDGLVRRRAAEKALFLTPPEGFRFVPTPVLRPEPDGSVVPDAATPAAEVEAPMSGDLAIVERVPARPPEPAMVAPPPPLRPVEAAADAVFSRLQSLFPESDGASPRSAAELVEPPSPAPPLSHEAPPARPPEPEPAPEPPPPPFPERESPAVFPHADAPAPLPPAPLIGADDPFTEPTTSSASEYSTRSRYRAATAAPEGFAEEARGAPGRARARAYWLVGLLGLIMFVAAIAWIVRGQADARNLLLGLAGVIFMAPAFAAVVLPLLNRGGGDRR